MVEKFDGVYHFQLFFEASEGTGCKFFIPLHCLLLIDIVYWQLFVFQKYVNHI